MKLMLGCIVGITLGIFASHAMATRNTAGTYSLPAGNPVVSGTSISSTWANNTLNDIATETTNSLDRNGRGGMLAALRGTDGTAVSPAYSFTSEPGTGLYRVGTSDMALSVGGTKQEEWTTTAQTIVQPLTCNSTLAVNGAATVTGALAANSTATVTGALAANSTANVAGNFTVATNKFNVTATTGSVAVGAVGPSAGVSPNISIMNAAGQSNFYMQDGRGAVGNKLGRIIYDGSSAGGGTGNLTKPGWVFQNVDDTGVFVSSNLTLYRDGSMNTGALTIGSTGTAISGSYRGTGSVTGSLAAASCIGNQVTVTGAVTGADCVVTPASGSVFGAAAVYMCEVDSINQCHVQVCNSTAGAVGSATYFYSCRVFNP